MFTFFCYVIDNRPTKKTGCVDCGTNFELPSSQNMWT